jgi:tetratricopeptide (TPR) repeat protein
LNKYKEALQVALKIVKIYKEKEIPIQEGFEYIGYAFLKTGDYNEAKVYFDKQVILNEKILKLDPLSNNPRLSQAKVYASLGKKKEALQIFIDLDKDNTERGSKISQIMPQVYLYMLKYEPLYENIMNETWFQNYINLIESKYKTDFEKINLWLKNKGVLKE